MSTERFEKRDLNRQPEYTGSVSEKCREVIMGSRAFTLLLAEAYANGDNETGGNFIGHVENGIWYIVESTLPGFSSHHSPCLFSMNNRYVNYAYRGIARIYRKEPELLGFWHRHPGNFNRFSANDDAMNRAYAKAVGDGTITFLLNFLPEPVITAYYYDLTEDRYYRTDLKVDDYPLIQRGYYALSDRNMLKEKAPEMMRRMKGYQ